MHDLIAKLTKMLSLTPEQQFRVSAMIKRHIHGEKADLCHRLFLYGQGRPIVDRTDPENPKVTGHEAPKNPFLQEVLKLKYEGHADWAKLPDEEVITWSVGSHKYVQKVQPCSVCGAELTGKSYTSTYNKTDGHKTFCPAHAPKGDES